MGKNLSGKTTVVLGGAGNVGEGIVKAHLKAGAKVIVPGRNYDGLMRLKELISHEGEGLSSNLVTIQDDTSSYNTLKNVVKKIKEEHGDISHAVASIGGWWRGSHIENVSEEEWKTHFLDPLTGHFAFASVCSSELQDGGSYTVLQGNTVDHNYSNMSLMLLQGTSVDSLWRSLSSDTNGRIRVNGLAIHAVRTRARSHQVLDENMLSADDVGVLTTAIATSDIVNKQIKVSTRNNLKEILRKLN